MKFFKHLHNVNKHRFNVFILCTRIGMPIRGLCHDLSKYSFIEFFESVKYYTDGKISPLLTCKNINGYSKGWLHHKGRNKHHFEYWFDPAAPVKTPIIPYKYMAEMVCDRIAASIVYYKKDYTVDIPYKYFMERKDSYNIHPKMNDFLEEVFYNYSKDGNKFLKKKNLIKIYNKHAI